jgi:signal transduction histidine kinase
VASLRRQILPFRSRPYKVERRFGGETLAGKSIVMSGPATHAASAAILIVDDTPANLAVMVDCLEAQGFRVLVAQDGEEGVRRAEYVHPDLILLDVMLPVLNGFVTCQRLKANAATRDIPVIFMTALADTNSKITGFAAGGVDYVTKPFETAEVLARVNAHLAVSAMQSRLAAQNLQLQHEIAQRQRVEEKLRLLNMELEDRVYERTVDLEATNRQLLEANQELRLTKAEAENANAAKSRFLAAASHDLRQPLDAMSLLIGCLLRRVSSGRVREIVEQLSSSLDVMIRLFNALLDLSKLDAGAVPVNLGPVPVATAFEHLRSDFAMAARHKGLDLRIVPSDMVLHSDAVLLERILRNLVSNAIRHTAAGRVLVGCRHRGDKLRIDVLDTGPGIPADMIGAIFDEFYQIGNPARLHTEGHGLGLAIVRRTARLLEHRLEVVPAPGRGMRFSIEVPVMAAPAPSTTKPLPEAFPEQQDCSVSVLLVEDDPLVAEAMQLALEDLGCRVRCAGSGEEALDLARRSAPQMMIADYRLPGDRNGLDTIIALRILAGKDFPAAIITGDLAADIQVCAEAAGVNFLHKPIHPEDLGKLVRDACRLQLPEYSIQAAG